MRINKTFILPWQMKSRGAHELSKSLGIKRILRENSKFVGSPDKTVINWGCSETSPEIQKCGVINRPSYVATSVNKLKFFNTIDKLKAARIPRFTESSEEAVSWVKNGKKVVGRTKLTAHSGSGIVFFEDNVDEFLSAKLFTVYIPKKEEYRVHIAFGNIIDVQQKVLRKTDLEGKPIDPKTVDFRIRSYQNGFIFQRQGIDPPKDVLTQALGAFKASKLDFGAVDVVFNDKSQEAYVLEINTSPGLEGTTIESYTNAFKKELT